MSDEKRYVKYEEGDHVYSGEVLYQTQDKVFITKPSTQTKKSVPINDVIQFYEDEDPDIPDNTFF